MATGSERPCQGQRYKAKSHCHGQIRALPNQVKECVQGIAPFKAKTIDGGGLGGRPLQSVSLRCSARPGQEELC